MRMSKRVQTKQELELAKLSCEVDRLRRPIFFEPGFLSPIAVALLGIIVVYLSGWFDLRKEALKIETAQLKEEKETVQKEYAQLQTDLEKSRHDLKMLQRDKRYLSNLWSRVPSRGQVVSDFLSSNPGLSREQLEGLLKDGPRVKSSFWGDFEQNVQSFSRILKERPFVQANTLSISYVTSKEIHWRFIGSFQDQYKRAAIFILLWARTPMAAKDILKQREYQDILPDGTRVRVESPFHSFHSPGISQDEDLFAICSPVGVQSEKKTLQETLIEMGLAVYYRGQSNAPWDLHNKLVQAQEKARAGDLGLWALYPQEMAELASREWAE